MGRPTCGTLVYLDECGSQSQPLAPVEPCFNLMSPHGSRNMANASVHVGNAGNPEIWVNELCSGIQIPEGNLKEK